MAELPIHYSEVESVYSQTIGANYRTVAVTSAAPGEGKSMLAEALVRRAEAAQKKVLLVEMNTFNPALKEKLQSLSQQPFNENKIMAVGNDGMSFLSAPSNANAVATYRETNLLIEAINQWLESFDCIIFDTASLAMRNQHNIPAESICQVCDGTIMVVEAGRTPANLIEEGINKLSTRRVNIVGTVINDRTNPTLLSELVRETRKFDRYVPKLMSMIRSKLEKMILLKVSI